MFFSKHKKSRLRDFVCSTVQWLEGSETFDYLSACGLHFVRCPGVSYQGFTTDADAFDFPRDLMPRIPGRDYFNRQV